MTTVSIALDAMGGDHGPKVIVPAALDMLAQHPTLRIILVGDQEFLSDELQEQGQRGSHPRLTIVHASEEVSMDEAPSLALRKKSDSSMLIAINLVKQGLAQAMVSAGNTGALMAIARFVLKTLPGIDRPAIVYSVPTLKGHSHVLDLGANVDCEARHLFEFAVMGSVLAAAVDNNPKPRVALLNIGSEAIKGSLAVKEAAVMLASLNKNELNYIGFIEGNGLYQGRADVVVCDGFVGNVAIKVSEGLITMILASIQAAFKRNWMTRLSALFAWPVLKRLEKELDPRQYNGASLLGLRGVVIKSHGNADRKSFAEAIRVAMLEAQKNVPEKIQNQVVEQLSKSRVE